MTTKWIGSGCTSISYQLIIRIVLLSICCTQAIVGTKNRPNIVVIMADDMGFDDVSFRGLNEFLTPNIDAFAFSGVILNQYYVPPMCTPSRSAFMTGKSPINIGMQHFVIANDAPWGLPLKEKTIAQYFKEAGYFTSLIGKWHLGFSKKAYTPLYRGFDHHFGYYGGYIGYYDQTCYTIDINNFVGHDFRRNLNSTRENQGCYVTDSLTEEAEKVIKDHDTNVPLFMILGELAPHAGNPDKPFEAPAEEVEKFKHIEDIERRIYAAMVLKLDQSVGRVVEALNAKGILDNTILLFYSDNGAPSKGLHANKGSNHPFRGQKNSPWEGAIRSSGAIWSPLIQNGGRIWNQTMHVSDWLPTLAHAAGIKLDDNLNLDGLNLWPNLRRDCHTFPRKLVHNIDDIFNYVSYRSGKWKYVNGTTLEGEYDGWLMPREEINVDPKSENYENVVKETKTWKILEQYKKTDDYDNSNILALRQKTSINCAFDTEVSKCEPLKEECIFNMHEDPCEQNNLIDQLKHSRVLKKIRAEVEELRNKSVKPLNKPADPKSDPKFFSYEWTWWQDL